MYIYIILHNKLGQHFVAWENVYPTNHKEKTQRRRYDAISNASNPSMFIREAFKTLYHPFILLGSGRDSQLMDCDNPQYIYIYIYISSKNINIPNYIYIYEYIYIYIYIFYQPRTNHPLTNNQWLSSTPVTWWLIIIFLGEMSPITINQQWFVFHSTSRFVG